MRNPVPDISENRSNDSAKLQNSILIIGGSIGTGVVQNIEGSLSIQRYEGPDKKGTGTSVGTQGRG